MKPKCLPVILFLLISAYCCKGKEDQNKTGYPAGCINLSELTANTDYYLPFSVVNDNDLIRLAFLNDREIKFSSGDFIEFRETGFFKLVLVYSDPAHGNDTVLFTTRTSEREPSEWGIRAWIPEPFKTSVISSEIVEAIYPGRFTDSINVPFIFYVKESGTVKALCYQGFSSSLLRSFNIKRGVGSVNINASSISGEVKFLIGGKKIIASLVKVSSPGIELKGSINSAVEIPANSTVSISSNLEITPAGSLKINEGTLVLIGEAVDINVNGPVTISGTAANPVLFVCSRSDKYWGGFIQQVPAGTINARYAIFTGSGYNASDGYDYGHIGRQALFYTENSSLTLDHCFMLDHAGQIFYPQYSTLLLEDVLVQRVQTGGQINYSNVTIKNSFFTDFPDDSYSYQDNDNDALYLNASDAEITNSWFMYAKDDGIDSGDEGGGEVIVTDCRFEACFHEGAALSSRENVVKSHIFNGCLFTNCGQGLELGFSSGDHLVSVENCLFLENGIGIRYGDNYEWSEVNGRMSVKNSFSLYNDRDVWNMIRMQWRPKLQNMTFENTTVSKFCSQYPLLAIKNH